MSTHTYTLKRTDKKKYEVTALGKTVELKLTAAIYEANETLDGNLLVRIGTRSLFIYNSELETVLNLKEADNIQSVVPGKDSVMVMTKGEIKGYSWAGTLLSRYSSIPKADSKGYWIPKKEVFMWVVRNNLELIVASISQKGEILRSQSFSRREYHRDPHVSLDKGLFVIEGNQNVMAYKLKFSPPWLSSSEDGNQGSSEIQSKSLGETSCHKYISFTDVWCVSLRSN